MPFAQLEDVRIHYDLAGPSSAPALVFSNSLGATLSMWDPQMPVFEKNSASCAPTLAGTASLPSHPVHTRSTSWGAM